MQTIHLSTCAQATSTEQEQEWVESATRIYLAWSEHVAAYDAGWRERRRGCHHKDRSRGTRKALNNLMYCIARHYGITEAAMKKIMLGILGYAEVPPEQWDVVRDLRNLSTPKVMTSEYMISKLVGFFKDEHQQATSAPRT